MHVFLDSPMAISATKIFKHHIECLEPKVAAIPAPTRLIAWVALR